MLGRFYIRGTERQGFSDWLSVLMIYFRQIPFKIPWLKSQPNGKEDQNRLLVIHTSENKSVMMDVESNYRYCFQCQFDRPPRFKTFGMTRKCKIDDMYDMIFDRNVYKESGGYYGFKGFKVK